MLGVIGVATAAPWNLAVASKARPRRIGIALGGGGLLGLAYVGAIRALQRFHFRPNVTAGCSAGVGRDYHNNLATAELADAGPDVDVLWKMTQ